MKFFWVELLKLRHLVAKSLFRQRFLFLRVCLVKITQGLKRIPLQFGHVGPDRNMGYQKDMILKI